MAEAGRDLWVHLAQPPAPALRAGGPGPYLRDILEISKEKIPQSLGNLWRRWESKWRGFGVLIGTEVDLKAWTLEVCQNKEVPQ